MRYLSVILVALVLLNAGLAVNSIVEQHATAFAINLFALVVAGYTLAKTS